MGECRKFVPNVFNKAKCSNCFKQIGEHSSQAIEFHKVSKKVLKSGYLFVAPGWDFSNPLHRTKRWQRRWFVLYDDGELSYSVDDHPDTIPQAKLNLTTILEVTSAEEITGHEFSLAISAVDRVHFVKATCREDVRDWTNMLITVQKNMAARTKRNSTVYNGKIILKQQNQIIPINNNSSYTTTCYHVSDNKNNCNYESKLICDVIDGRKTSNYLTAKSLVPKTSSNHSINGGGGVASGPGSGGISNENYLPKQLPNRRCDIIDEKMKNSKKLKTLKSSKIGNNLSACSAAAATAASSSSIITAATTTATMRIVTAGSPVAAATTVTTNSSSSSSGSGGGGDGSNNNISKRESRSNSNRCDWFDERKTTDYLSKGKEITLSNGSSSNAQHYINKTKEQQQHQPIMDKYNNHNHKNNGKIYETLIEPKINQLPNSDRSYGHLVNCSSSSSSTSSLSLLSSSSSSSSAGSSITNCYCASSSSSLSSSSSSPSPPVSTFANQKIDRNHRMRTQSSWNGHGNGNVVDEEQVLENGAIDQIDLKNQNKSSESIVTTRTASDDDDDNMFSLLNHKNGSLARLEFNEKKMNGNQTLLFDEADDQQQHQQQQPHDVNCWRKGWLMAWTAVEVGRGNDDIDDGIGGDIDEDFVDRQKCWQKYWFVLCERTLNSYRDQEAENVGDFVHSIDLNSIATVTEQVDCDRNYGFQILLHNGNKYLLSSLTKGIRANWVKNLKHNLANVFGRRTATTIAALAVTTGSSAAKFDSKIDLDKSVDLLSPESNNSIPLMEAEAAVTASEATEASATVTAFSSSNSDNPVTATTSADVAAAAATVVVDTLSTSTSRSNLFSSDEEYKTASEGTGGRRESEIWLEPAMHLPPSPLLNRTVLSKIKDRDRYRVNNKTAAAAAVATATVAGAVAATENGPVNGKHTIRSSAIQSADDESSGSKANGTTSVAITKDLQLKWHLLFQKQQRELDVLNRKLKTMQQEKKQFEALMIQWDKRVNILNDFMKNIRDFLKVHCKNAKSKEDGNSDNDDDNENGDKHRDDGNRDIDDCGTVIYQLKKCFGVFKSLVRKQTREIAHLKETVRLYDLNDSYLAADVVAPSPNSSSSSINGGGGGVGCGGDSQSGSSGGCSETKPKKLSTINRVDSLTDLTSIHFEEIDFSNHDEVIRQFEDLKQRFDKAISEIRLIKKELRESYKSFDNLELKNFSLNQDLKTLDTNYKSQINLMAERIQDLTVKLSTAEKQNRIFKSKVHHTKDKYRSLSLITNTESFLVQKEIEDKITNLEKKINNFEEKEQESRDNCGPVVQSKTGKFAALSSTALKDPLKLIIKLNSLDKKLSGILSSQKKNRNHNDSVVDDSDDADADANDRKEKNDDDVIVGLEDLLKSILKENYEIFEEQLRKFQNCFETKIAQQLKPSLRLLTLSHDSPIANIDLIACQLALQKIQFDCFVLVSNSFLSQKQQQQQQPPTCELSQRLQFFYDNFLPLFNDCVAQTISESNSSTFLITTTFVPQHILDLFEKIVLDVRLYENLFERQFSMPKLSINTRENFAGNLQKLDDGLLDMLEVAKKHEQKTSSNLENCKNECEQKIKNLQKMHEAQIRNLETSFENKKSIFKKIADNEHGMLMKKNRELQTEIDQLKNEIEASKTSIHQLCLQQYSGCGNAVDTGITGTSVNSAHGFCFDEIYHFDENNIRKKYQSEIEQLKILCEKGILAMESSHKRIIGEMENKHRQERKQLLIEKEQALAEETQATLSALEAMRKAHEVEVQREIVKFKEEFMRNVKSSQDIEALHKEHEIEMKDIRQEILSLSEKYTMKCIECANLEQKLCYITTQLNQGHHHHHNNNHHQNVLHIDTGHSNRRHCCYMIDTAKNLLENSNDERKKLSKTNDYFLSV